MTSRPPTLFARLARLLVLAAWVWAGLVSANAASLTAAEEQGVRETVQGQLAAFAADDANKAFSYATPHVRETMGNAASFLALVRKAYPMVYRPASVAFLKPESRDGQVIQRVQVLDAGGASWLAIYGLERHGNAWRISGCVVVEDKRRMA
ncbi:DUF4864 domain-containing protein [Polaromonas sp. SM01]|uniref:DUF4864 domain-containing protein n=1 Tax=Polaromonas sp. SM01 TaxID=3085630 RepID=UPI002982A01C|nr:DUF4864 domain-containing protein [Polaromonas sp. SM01]MDW5443437.1 DUF4864 domain-containing protein [Polaromonas sp. SM01]